MEVRMGGQRWGAVSAVHRGRNAAPTGQGPSVVWEAHSCAERWGCGHRNRDKNVAPTGKATSRSRGRGPPNADLRPSLLRRVCDPRSLRGPSG